MASENGDERREQKSWAEWKQELYEAIQDLDEACANARQVIYRLRPLVRPKTTRGEDRGEERTDREEPPVPLERRRRFRRERS